MSLKFNLNRPKLSDEEIEAHRDFDALVKKFKAESLKKARGDESWWKNKKITYTTVIAGLTVVCTITYLSLLNKKQENKTKHETLITQKSQSKTNKFVQAPHSKLTIPYQNFKVDNSKGSAIKANSQSKITIPKNCFVDKNGQNIVGEVSIQYREFNGLHEIMASGIPMAYDSAQEHFQLESAGMFEIKGHVNNEPVFIAKDKKIEVCYASDNHENRFNQYYLDTVKKNWTYIKRDDIKNESIATTRSKPLNKTSIEALSQEVELILPKKIDSVKQVFTKRIEVLPKTNKPQAPIQSKPGRPIFQIDREAQDFPELSAFDNVVFEVGEENKNYTDQLHEITWSDIKIAQGPVKGKNYWLHLAYRARKVSLIVYPVFTGSNYEKAMDVYQVKLKEYESIQAKRMAEEKRLISEMELKQANYIKLLKEKQALLEKEKQQMLLEAKNKQVNQLSSTFNQLSNQFKTQRIFEVFNFGIYNSDCAKQIPNEQLTQPVFVSVDNQMPIRPDMVYIVNKTKSTVLGLSRENSFEFGYNLTDEFMLCAFVKNDIFLCDPVLFKTSIQNDKHQFLLNTITAQASNLNTFKKALSL